MAVEAQLVTRQEARSLGVQAVLAAARSRHVAIAVEEREALAVLEDAGRIAGARGGREDIPAVLDADRFVRRRFVLHAEARTPVAGRAPARASRSRYTRR